MVTGRVMGRILEVSDAGETKGLLTHVQLIHEWKNTLCVQSKYKEDLVHIRDMHRLLSYKGKYAQALPYALNHRHEWGFLTCFGRIPIQILRCRSSTGRYQP